MSTQKRRSRYYSRVKVPADLRPILGKNELVRSLRTSRYREAIARGSEWEGRVAKLFRKIRKDLLSMTPQDISKLVQTYVQRELEENEQAITECEDMSSAAWEGIAFHMHDELKAASGNLIYNELDKVVDVANALLVEHSINIDRESPHYKRLCRELLKARLKVLQTSYNRWHGDYSEEPLVNVGQVPQEHSPQTAPLSKVVVEFIKAKELEGSWAYRTGVMFKSGLELFLDVMGDRPIGDVTKEDIRRFHETLQRLPTSMTQRFPELSLEEILKLDAKPKLSSSSVANGIEVTPNRVNVFTPGAEVFAYMKPHTSLMALSISAEALERRIDSPAASFLEENAASCRVLRSTRQNTDDLRRWGTRLMRQFGRGPIPSGQSERLVDETLLVIARALKPVDETRSTSHRRRFVLAQRAREYMLDRQSNPPTILDICTELNCSERTLHLAFSETYGVSPKRFLKAHRLYAVHRELKCNGACGRVWEIAGRYGFWDLGYFARDYRAMFGELPSATLGAQYAHS